eukprot:4914423-Pyramimonas_sp.AAC.2
MNAVSCSMRLPMGKVSTERAQPSAMGRRIGFSRSSGLGRGMVSLKARQVAKQAPRTRLAVKAITDKERLSTEVETSRKNRRTVVGTCSETACVLRVSAAILTIEILGCISAERV